MRHFPLDDSKHVTVIVFFDASGTARDGRPYANTYAWFLWYGERQGSEGVGLLRQHRVRRLLAAGTT
jgi:hypothetical protein